MPALTPKYERPSHLARICEFFDRVSRGEVLRWLVSAPPQYGKSEVMGHGVARELARHPDWPFIYASYGASLAEQKSRAARDYARACGVELREDADAVGDWLTPGGGGLRARGIGGATTGNPAKVFIVDDPHKDRREADSALMRQNVFEWFTSVAETRCHPDSSILVCHARWDEDDLIGRLRALRDGKGRPRFEHFNLSAILDDGRPLWHRRPLDWLEPKKAFEHDWWSLWMGRPRGRGSRLFKGVHYYDRLPDRFRVGKGVDFAYTEAKRACHSAGVTLVEHEGVSYVVDVRRGQVEAPAFAAELQAVDLSWPGPWHWFVSTTERGTAQLLRVLGVDIEDVLASIDKFDRAQAVAAAWNAGKVRVPRNMAALLGARARPGDDKRQAPWLRDFVDEVGQFTGEKRGVNDQVDALASGYEGVRYSGDIGVEQHDDPDARWRHDERGYG